jgi:hypothetical protein
MMEFGVRGVHLLSVRGVHLLSPETVQSVYKLVDCIVIGLRELLTEY